MKKGKILLTLLIFIFANMLSAENVDSIKLVRLEQSLQKEIKVREALTSKLDSQADAIERQSQSIDTLTYIIKQNAKNIKVTAEQLGVKINETNVSLGTKADTSDVNTKAIWGVGLFVLLIIVGGIIYYFLHKRINKGNADVNVLKEKAEKLNENILNQFSLEISEIQKISSSLDALSKTTGTGVGEPDHSLIKILADRITFMEMTLYKMDPKVKGFKQLSTSISQMKDNLLANGYELVEMLGKPYNDGMKAVANFNDDEDIENGQRIITAIIKPQINYKGQMIQAAQITVSQNV